ncbi:cms1 ribosomal small subunit [Sorochytrium milnesiophthora]
MTSVEIDEDSYLAGSQSDSDVDADTHALATRPTLELSDDEDVGNDDNGKDDEQAEYQIEAVDDSTEQVAGKKRKKQSDRPSQAKVRKQSRFEAELQDSIPSEHTPEAQSALFIKQLAQHMIMEKKMTRLETDEHILRESCFMDVTAFDAEHNDANFGRFIKHVAPQVASPPQGQKQSKKGDAAKVASPAVIVLCAAGIRCVDVIRFIKAELGGSPADDDAATGKKGHHRQQQRYSKHRSQAESGPLIAKLFAKHMGVPEQAAFLKQRADSIDIAVGTANRILKLLDMGALSLANTRVLVLDASFIDSKRRTLLTQRESRQDFFELFTKKLSPALRQVDKDNKTDMQIALY